MRKYFLLMPILIFSIIVFNIHNIYAAYSEIEAADLYNRAGTLYQNSKFGETLGIYEELIENGITNPDLYYNASNAAYRSGSPGKAILYLERSLKLAPSDPDAISNLTYLNLLKKDKEPLDGNIVMAFFLRLYNSIDINSAALWSGMSFALAMLLATGALFLKNWKRTTLIGISLFCVLAFIISTGLFTHKIHKNNTVVEAIIMIDEAEAYSGPGKENTHIFTINEGTKVVIDRGQNSWNLIRLKSGAGGWVHSDCMEKI